MLYITVFDHKKTNELEITRNMNRISKHLEFKATMEDSNSINYLDPTIFRNTNSIELGIYKKPTSAAITIHYTSNHPWEHKKAAYTYYINRALTLPITEQARVQEWLNISSMAKTNGFPKKIHTGNEG